MLSDFINHCEDSLTASVFSHLLHLPTELWWQLLREACYSRQLPAIVGELRSVDFRPKWDPTGVVTGNNTYVEPDLFLRFASLDVIIEAKRWDRSQQNPRQWDAQLRAYWNEYVRGKKAVIATGEVRIIALGGLWTFDDQEASGSVPAADEGPVATKDVLITCPVHMCQWGRLLAGCKRMAREIERIRYPSSQTYAHRRVLDHLVGLFNSHDFQTGVWYEELLLKRSHFGTTLLSSQAALQRLSTQYSSQ